MFHQTQNGSSEGQGHNEGQDDLRVTISAAGRADLDSGDGSNSILPKLIHAITVSQPIQSWTVIRDHLDFITLGTALSTVIAGIPQCPPLPSFAQPNANTVSSSTTRSSSSSNASNSNSNSNSGDIDNIQVAEILQVRSAAQAWLTNVLLFPGARESPAVRQFLCYGANSVPAQYQGIHWITITDNEDVGNSSPTGAEQHHQQQQHQQQHQHQQRQSDNHDHAAHAANASASHMSSVDELEMDAMFGYDDGPGDDEEDDEEDYEDDADFFSATERYQPTIEAVTKDDMMELNNADDVEMIEDVGSLAQSMGASHLGRSLQLQAVMSGKQHVDSNEQLYLHQQQGGQEHSAAAAAAGASKFSDSSHGAGAPLGGIGNAVEKAGIQQEAAVDGLSDSFYQKAPISLPRLDSFKMIKVVGKGSFGKSISYVVVCLFVYVFRSVFTLISCLLSSF